MGCNDHRHAVSSALLAVDRDLSGFIRTNRNINHDTDLKYPQNGIFGQRTAWLGHMGCNDHRHAVISALLAVDRDLSGFIRTNRNINHDTYLKSPQNGIFGQRTAWLGL
jgi:phage host-nuclease inhibitor protein Gam